MVLRARREGAATGRSLAGVLRGGLGLLLENINIKMETVKEIDALVRMNLLMSLQVSRTVITHSASWPVTCEGLVASMSALMEAKIPGGGKCSSAILKVA
jgi:hypothetical protein